MTSINQVVHTVTTQRDVEMRAISEKLEAQFLAEMLKSAGVGKARESFGGGAGEDHFSSFLTTEYAKATVQAGGIGLSEAIFKALTASEVNS